MADSGSDPDFEDAADEAYAPYKPDEPYIDLSHVPSEWERRSRKLYEETCSNIPLYFGLGILRAAPPEAGVLSELSNDRKACLRCLDC